MSDAPSILEGAFHVVVSYDKGLSRDSEGPLGLGSASNEEQNQCPLCFEAVLFKITMMQMINSPILASFDAMLPHYSAPWRRQEFQPHYPAV